MTLQRALSTVRRLSEEATPGRWHPAYWPDPEPHYWIGLLPKEEWSSKMEGQITGPIASESDAALIAAAPDLAASVEELAKKGQRFREAVRILDVMLREPAAEGLMTAEDYRVYLAGAWLGVDEAAEEFDIALANFTARFGAEP